MLIKTMNSTKQKEKAGVAVRLADFFLIHQPS